MANAARSQIASSFTNSKDALIGESFAIFASWDFALSKTENLSKLRTENFIGAKSAGWLEDLCKVFGRRYDPDTRDRALVYLAQKHCPLDIWKPILLWHLTRDEFLVRDFLMNWLFPAYEAGAFVIRPDAIHEHLRTVAQRGGVIKNDWKPSSIDKVSSTLIKIAADFGLLQGKHKKEFASYHLPEESFLYLLHAMKEAQPNPRKLIESNDWHLFLMRTEEVERELLRLHQFRKLDYQVAGSIVQLGLPCKSALEYAERIVS